MKQNYKKIEAICEEGVCPICGGELEYSGVRNDDDNGCTYPWTCKKCGAAGKEGYSLSFDGNHYDVETKDGEPVKIVAPVKTGEEPTEETRCPICNGVLEYTGNAGETKSGICQEWRCTKCNATGWAKYEEETEYTFTGEHEDVCLADGSEWNGETITSEDSDIPWYPADKSPTSGSITLMDPSLDMDDAIIALCKANISAHEENGMIFIHQAPVTQAVDVLAAEGILTKAVCYDPTPVKAATGWFVPVTWEMMGVVRIPFEDAPTLADAFKRIKEDPNISLPMGYYVDESFAPSYDMEQIEEVRSAYNNNQPDQEEAEL